jgi:hypothetical protein
MDLIVKLLELTPQDSIRRGRVSAEGTEVLETPIEI